MVKSIALPVDTAIALISLYLGMLDASTNGSGYSPMVAEAMKALRESHPTGFKIPTLSGIA